MRSDRVWARSTRAPHAQPVIAMIRPISTSLVAPEGDRKPKITMSSGRAGMTRKKLASMDSSSSAHRPCRYPAQTPITTDKMVAAIPARNATRIVLRPPASSCENTSCWVWVVPSQCAADGGCGTPFVVDRLAPGLYGATRGPMMATTRNTASMASPAMILGERGSWIRRPRIGAVTGAAAARRPAGHRGQIRRRLRRPGRCRPGPCRCRLTSLRPPGGCAGRGARTRSPRPGSRAARRT